MKERKEEERGKKEKEMKEIKRKGEMKKRMKGRENIRVGRIKKEWNKERVKGWEEERIHEEGIKKQRRN